MSTSFLLKIDGGGMEGLKKHSKFSQKHQIIFILGFFAFDWSL